jgi:DNA topoisomerase-1
MSEPSTGPAAERPPEQVAASAGLRYVLDDDRGYTRRRWGGGFTYRDWRGRTVRSRKLRQRFNALAIPPAWTEVWIARHENDHIQATGRDEAGRKQYIYHERWRAARDREKYDLLIAFARLLPRIRRRVDEDLEREGLARAKVLAAVVRLLERTLVRVGNDRYARENRSYGLTTIRKRHVEPGDTLEAGSEGYVLEFEGKGGRPWRIEIEDPRVAEVVEECLETPGYELFKYVDDEGVKRDVTSDDVNAYLREAGGETVTAKRFRTWAGTVLAAMYLRQVHEEGTEPETRKQLLRGIERVAEHLGNTPAICREAYIHPAVLEGFEQGELLAHLAHGGDELEFPDDRLAPQERAVLRYLERCRDRRGG